MDHARRLIGVKGVKPSRRNTKTRWGARQVGFEETRIIPVTTANNTPNANGGPKITIHPSSPKRSQKFDQRLSGRAQK